MVTIRSKGGRERAPLCRVPCAMEHGQEKLLQMRILAARLRGQAAETSLEIFKFRLLATAAELEKAALKLESSTPCISQLSGTNPEYRAENPGQSRRGS